VQVRLGQVCDGMAGERIRRTSSRPEPLNPVGTRSTASPSLGLQLGTQWNASLPVPAGRFMGSGGEGVTGLLGAEDGTKAALVNFPGLLLGGGLGLGIGGEGPPLPLAPDSESSTGATGSPPCF
jgi:hypothetical protein